MSLSSTAPIADEMDVRFRHHEPSDGDAHRHALARGEFHELAMFIEGFIPDSREKALALTNLEQSLMWCNAAIARARPRHDLQRRQQQAREQEHNDVPTADVQP